MQLRELRRLKKRHAWAAVLLFAFVLPILKPAGFPALEGLLDQTLAWPARSGLGAPSPVRSGGGDAGGDSSRVADLERMLLESRERYFEAQEVWAQRLGLAEVTKDLDRKPRAVAAGILRSKDASAIRRSILVNRGSDDGLSLGLAVTQGGVFLGTVAHVSARSARVQLLTDPYSRLEVAVRTQEGVRAVAWVRGEDAESLRLRHLVAAVGLVVRPVDPVVTGNADPAVPAGLVVGEVVTAADPDADGVVDARVKPGIDLDRATSVLVLLPSK